MNLMGRQQENLYSKSVCVRFAIVLRREIVHHVLREGIFDRCVMVAAILLVILSVARRKGFEVIAEIGVGLCILIGFRSIRAATIVYRTAAQTNESLAAQAEMPAPDSSGQSYVSKDYKPIRFAKLKLVSLTFGVLLVCFVIADRLVVAAVRESKRDESSHHLGKFRDVADVLTADIGGNKVPLSEGDKSYLLIEVNGEIKIGATPWTPGTPLASARVENGELLISAELMSDKDHYVRLVDNQLHLQGSEQEYTWDRNYDDKGLEVVNATGRVVLQVEFKSASEVQVLGYFRGPLSSAAATEHGVTVSVGVWEDFKEYPLKKKFKYPSGQYMGERDP